MSKPIRVLVVDDSMLFRRTIVEGLSRNPNIEVVAMAADPYEARDCILKYKPDVMTLDVEMPRMNGIEFLKKLMPQYPIPTIMVSAVDHKVFEALKYGALDFVVKSNIASNSALEDFLQELTGKVVAASEITMSKATVTSEQNKKTQEPLVQSNIDIIALGASTGGTEATELITSKLPNTLPPMIIVQHMPPVFTHMYADRLNKSSAISFKEAESGDILLPGHGYVAQGSDHLKLVQSGSQMMLKCFVGPKVNGHMPSVDVTFASVAKYYTTNALGVILTGMGNDGSKGLLAMRQQGARTIGQDEASSVVYGMPKKAYELGAVEIQSSIHRIAQNIIDICL